ncbi:MAG: TonB family protein, partial [Bacteroidota bacterium]
KKADLERKKTVFLQIGLIIALAFVYMAFEWQTADLDKSRLSGTSQGPDEGTDVINTWQEPPVKPPPPQVVHDEIQIVEDDVDIEEDLIVDNPETDTWDAVDYQMEDEADTLGLDVVLEPWEVEQDPVFPGGEEAYLRYIMDNVEIPDFTKDIGTNGKVCVGFIIDKKGNVTDVHIVRSMDPYVDNAVMKVFKAMPKWSPALQLGQPAAVKRIGVVSIVVD